jgi:hypothetical protein
MYNYAAQVIMFLANNTRLGDYETVLSMEETMWIKLFGFGLAAGIVLTSLAMAWLGGRWQRIEASAYGSDKRPVWFWVLSLLLIGLYIAALVSFTSMERTWASWLLIVIIPLGWLLKAGLVVLNPRGRIAVSSVSGDKSWREIAVARLPIALILGVLAWFA